MQIIIEIPEDIYKEWKFDGKYRTHSYAQRLILDGTPLPEHHGRLIDADELEKEMRTKLSITDCIQGVVNASTIINGGETNA